MANDLLNREVGVRFKVQQEIIYEAQSDVNNRKNYLDELVYCGLLIIDDLNLQVVNVNTPLTASNANMQQQVVTGQVVCFVLSVLTLKKAKQDFRG